MPEVGFQRARIMSLVRQRDVHYVVGCRGGKPARMLIRPSTIGRRVAAIGYAHKLAGHHAPAMPALLILCTVLP